MNEWIEWRKEWINELTIISKKNAAYLYNIYLIYSVNIYITKIFLSIYYLPIEWLIDRGCIFSKNNFDLFCNNTNDNNIISEVFLLSLYNNKNNNNIFKYH